jgi:hypothetical protein
VSARPDPIDVTALSLAVASESTRREMRAVLRCAISADGREPPVAHRHRFDPSWSARVTLLAAIAATVPFAANLQEFSHAGATRTFLTAQGGSSHLRQSEPTSVGAAQKSVQSKEIGAMRLTSLAGVVAVGLSSASAAFAQDAVQWRVEDGGNGHWYRGVLPEPLVSWTTASAICAQQGGHLVTLTSSPELDFVFDRIVASTELWHLHQCDCISLGPWIGLRRVDGQWCWVTDEPYAFSAWHPGEPWEPRDFVRFFHYTSPLSPAPLWDNGPSGDEPEHIDDGTRTSFVVEWSADCNSDGIVDFGQIRDGELEDANANNIPDCCETSASCDTCPADVDESGAVSGVDLAAVLNSWGPVGAKYPRADVNSDGVVDGADLAMVLSAWGQCP